MEVAELLRRCVALERGAAEVYRTLAGRAGDAELERLWIGMAADEDEHARKLEAWRTLVLAEPAAHRPQAEGFAADVAVLENTMENAAVRARAAAGADEAFAIALMLETSELDAIYTSLLRASPLARFPDAAAYGRDSARHHDALLAAVRARPTTEANRLAAEILAAAHAEPR